MVLSESAAQFAEQYPEITSNHKYEQLKAVPRHGSTNTFDHSVRVAQRAYKLALFFGIDSVSAVRVGLLHDFCMIDYHKDDKDTHGGRWYCFYHGEDAVMNSEEQGFRLSQTEKRAILTHMFPLSTGIPNSKLGYILTLSDKTVAFEESWANVIETYAKVALMIRALRLRVAKVIPGRRR